VVGALRGCELFALGPPAARLDARHRDGERGLRGHQDRDVDDAVLLGPDELLAVDDEDGAPAVVDDAELRDVAGL
jgi:hypothetical protein